MDMIRINNGIYESEGFELAMDITVPQSTLVAVLGPSGAGKSTLLNLIAGFENLRSGTIALNGLDCTNISPSQRPVSLVFQDNNSFAHMTARNNVALGISPNLKLSQADWVKVDEALAQTSIADLANRKPGEMSGGERQRIALARSLVRNQPILLLDEAFAALGPALRNDMLDHTRDMQKKRNLTVLMVTHQPQDARRIADMVIFVNNSLVNRPVPTDHFFSSHDEAVKRYLGAPE